MNLRSRVTVIAEMKIMMKRTIEQIIICRTLNALFVNINNYVLEVGMSSSSREICS
jgi:hypothetical protein